MKLLTVLACITTLTLSGCSISGVQSTKDLSKLPGPTPIHEPRSKMGNMSSYEVWGERYHVMEDATGYTQEGIASWYGKKFHGNKTSNGEVYDMYAMSAAHKNLPLPSYVHVINKDNGREAIVRVNDRGPFHDNRIIDLSYRAAQELGFDDKGLANVRLTVVTPSKNGQINTKSLSRSTEEERLGLDKRWLNVQILLTRNRHEAEKLKQKLEPRLTHPVFIDSRPLSRDVHVRVGPIKGIDNARLLTEQMKELGYTDSFIDF